MTRLSALLARREAGIFVMLVAFILVIGAIEPRFLTLDSARIVLLAVPLILVGAMGQMMVIVARHVDLSMGSVMGFSAIAAGMMFRDHPDMPLAAGFLVAIGAGAALGLVNGLVVVLCNLPSIIVTLGTLSLFRGLLFILSGSRQIDPNQIPPDLIAMAQTSPLGIPWVVLIAFLVAILAYLLLTQCRIGREIYALGSNPLAARLRGIAVGRVTLSSSSPSRVRRRGSPASSTRRASAM